MDYLPGGLLGMPGSDSIIEPLVEYAALTSDVIILSRNMRPAGHTLPGCVKGTPGAKIVPDLAAFATRPKCYVISKSMEPDEFGYSAFEGGTLRPLETLEEILDREKVTHITVGGYWLDGCVAQTAFDANALGYATAVARDACWIREEFNPDHLKRAGVGYV